MTVKDLIKLLQTFPSNLQVAYKCCSEQVLLEAHEIEHVILCEERDDGWIQNYRPDFATKPYILFPGN